MNIPPQRNSHMKHDLFPCHVISFLASRSLSKIHHVRPHVRPPVRPEILSPVSVACRPLQSKSSFLFLVWFVWFLLKNFSLFISFFYKIKIHMKFCFGGRRQIKLKCESKWLTSCVCVMCVFIYAVQSKQFH